MKNRIIEYSYLKRKLTRVLECVKTNLGGDEKINENIEALIKKDICELKPLVCVHFYTEAEFLKNVFNTLDCELIRGCEIIPNSFNLGIVREVLGLNEENLKNYFKKSFRYYFLAKVKVNDFEVPVIFTYNPMVKNLGNKLVKDGGFTCNTLQMGILPNIERVLEGKLSEADSGIFVIYEGGGMFEN